MLRKLGLVVLAAAACTGCLGRVGGGLRSAGLSAGGGDLAATGNPVAASLPRPVPQALPQLNPTAQLGGRPLAEAPPERSVPPDPSPMPVVPEGGEPAPGLPKVEVVQPAAPANPAEPAWVRGSPTQPRPLLEELAGEAPVYAIEVPPAPPQAAFNLPAASSNDLPDGDSGVLGQVRNLHPDAAGPVPDAWVTVVSAANVARKARVRTDAQGRYRLYGVASGGYFAVVEKAGIGRSKPQYVLLGSGTTSGVDFAMFGK